MSGRCKACNSSLTEDEMTAKDKDGYFLDVCFNCIDSTLLATYSVNDYDPNSTFCRVGRSYPHNND